MHILIWAGPRSWSFELTEEWLAMLLDMAADVDGRPWIKGQAWERENPGAKLPRPRPSQKQQRHRNQRRR